MGTFHWLVNNKMSHCWTLQLKMSLSGLELFDALLNSQEESKVSVAGNLYSERTNPCSLRFSISCEPDIKSIIMIAIDGWCWLLRSFAPSSWISLVADLKITDYTIAPYKLKLSVCKVHSMRKQREVMHDPLRNCWYFE